MLFEIFEELVPEILGIWVLLLRHLFDERRVVIIIGKSTILAIVTFPELHHEPSQTSSVQQTVVGCPEDSSMLIREQENGQSIGRFLLKFETHVSIGFQVSIKI